MFSQQAARRLGELALLALPLLVSPAAAQPRGSAPTQQAVGGFQILQPLSDHILSRKEPRTGQEEFYIPIMLDKVRWGYLPNASAQPILTVPSGAVVTFDTVSHEGILEDQGRNPVKYFGAAGIPPNAVLRDAIAVAGSDIKHDFASDGPHVVTGPVAVAGAQPGDVLKVDILSVIPRVPYGVISNRHGKGALPKEFPETPGPEAGAGPDHQDFYHNVFHITPIRQIGGTWYGFLPTEGRSSVRIPIHPFQGTIGVAPNTTEHVNSIPPGVFGGNLDLNDLVAGATLYLPVQVPEALFFTADPHFAQGDGEIGLTALEGSTRVTFRLTVLKKGDPAIPGGSLDHPFAENRDLWIPIGLNQDLGEAMRDAVRQAIKFLSLDPRPHLTRAQALAYMSAATDFHVTEVVDKVLGVHAHIHKADFPNEAPQHRVYPH